MYNGNVIGFLGAVNSGKSFRLLIKALEQAELGKQVLLISMEMTKEAMASRIPMVTNKDCSEIIGNITIIEASVGIPLSELETIIVQNGTPEVVIVDSPIFKEFNDQPHSKLAYVEDIDALASKLKIILIVSIQLSRAGNSMSPITSDEMALVNHYDFKFVDPINIKTVLANAKKPIRPTGECDHQWDDVGETCVKCGDKDWM